VPIDYCSRQTAEKKAADMDVVKKMKTLTIKLYDNVEELSKAGIVAPEDIPISDNDFEWDIVMFAEIYELIQVDRNGDEITLHHLDSGVPKSELS
jgi:hypothetical protein